MIPEKLGSPNWFLFWAWWGRIVVKLLRAWRKKALSRIEVSIWRPPWQWELQNKDSDPQQAQMQQAQAQPPVPPPAPWRQEQPHATTKWQDSCWKRWNTGSSCWCNTCTMEWFCNCGRTVSMVKVVCEMPRTKLLAWRCLLKPLLFSVLIQFMQKEVHYLRVLGWFSKNEGGAISPGSGAVPTWFSIVRAAICMGWPAWSQLQCPYAKGSCCHQYIFWFWGDFQRVKEVQYLLVLWWFSQNEGLVVRRPYQSTKEAAPN